MIKITKLERELEDKTVFVNVTQRVINQYKSFDEVIFYLTENSSENAEAIRRMNVYQFYRHKQLVGKKIDAMNKQMTKHEDG